MFLNVVVKLIHSAWNECWLHPGEPRRCSPAWTAPGLTDPAARHSSYLFFAYAGAFPTVTCEGGPTQSCLPPLTSCPFHLFIWTAPLPRQTVTKHKQRTGREQTMFCRWKFNVKRRRRVKIKGCSIGGLEHDASHHITKRSQSLQENTRKRILNLNKRQEHLFYCRYNMKYKRKLTGTSIPG